MITFKYWQLTNRKFELSFTFSFTNEIVVFNVKFIETSRTRLLIEKKTF